MDSGRQRMNKRVLDWKMILQSPRYVSKSFFKGQVIPKNQVLIKTLSPTLKLGVEEHHISADF